RDDHCVVRDLQQPEQTVWSDPRIEIVHLRPRNGVEEVDSDLHEGAMRQGGFCLPRTSIHDGPHVLALIHADVRADVVELALIVGARARRIPHRYNAFEIGDAVGIRIEAIEPATHARKELIDERWARDAGRNDEWRKDVATGNGDREHLAVGWLHLTPQR